MIKALREAARLGDEALEEGVLAAAEVYQGEAQARVRRRSGELADHIIIEIVERKTGKVRAQVGPDDEHFYGLFLEFGTAEHTVDRANAALQTIDGEFYARVRVGGVPASPFMRPAVDNGTQAAVEAIADVVKRRLKL